MRLLPRLSRAALALARSKVVDGLAQASIEDQSVSCDFKSRSESNQVQVMLKSMRPVIIFKS